MMAQGTKRPAGAGCGYFPSGKKSGTMQKKSRYINNFLNLPKQLPTAPAN
jgi:hypothetical protein